MQKEPLDEYGKQKFASELYLKNLYRRDGFPATIIMPGQISGPGWEVINPWGNTSIRVFQDIADGKPIKLPNFGMEIIHNVHASDVAQCFLKAILARRQSLGESFDATAAQSVTLYGYARHMYEFFGTTPQIDFLPWSEWCAYEGDKAECEHSYYHLARSGTFSIEKPMRLLGYHPRYSCIDAIDQAVQSYLDRGLITYEK